MLHTALGALLPVLLLLKPGNPLSAPEYCPQPLAVPSCGPPRAGIAQQGQVGQVLEEKLHCEPAKRLGYACT